jgi:hypothetical protein
MSPGLELRNTRKIFLVLSRIVVLSQEQSEGKVIVRGRKSITAEKLNPLVMLKFG